MERAEADDAAFERLAEGFLAGWLERSPVAATEAGEHRYDGRWSDPSVEGEAGDRAFIAATRRDLDAIPRERLGAEARADHELLDNILRGWLFELDQERSKEADPLEYTRLIGDGI